MNNCIYFLFVFYLSISVSIYQSINKIRIRFGNINEIIFYHLMKFTNLKLNNHFNKAIKSMKRLSRGLASDDDGDDNLAEATVVRSGRKFIVRQTARSQIIELGRFVVFILYSSFLFSFSFSYLITYIRIIAFI